MREQDEADVIIWRVERLRDLGVAPDLAIELAERGVDYQKLERLLEAGCSPETAVRILS